jgi:hypothetical protein
MCRDPYIAAGLCRWVAAAASAVICFMRAGPQGTSVAAYDVGPTALHVDEHHADALVGPPSHTMTAMSSAVTVQCHRIDFASLMYAHSTGNW